MATIGNLVAFLGLDSASFTRNLGRARSDMTSSTGRMNVALVRFQRQAKKSFAAVSRSVFSLRTAIGLLAGGGGLRIVLKKFAEFDTSMRRIVGLVGVAEREVEGFRKSVLKLAPAVGKGPAELADAMFFITSAGFRGQKALDLLTASAKASVAGLGEVKDVADLLTGVLFTFKDLPATRAMDQFTASIREGKAEASTFGPALSLGLSTAKQAGVEFDELAATIALFSRQNIPAAQAITQLVSALVSLQKESGDTAELKKLGLTFQQLRDNVRQDLLGAFTDLAARIGDSETALAKIFPRAEAMRFVLNLTAGDLKETERLFREVAESIGAADKSFRSVAGGIDQELRVALANLDVALVKVGPELANLATDVLLKLPTAIDKTVKAFQTLVKWFGVIVVSAATVKGAMIGMGFGGLIGALIGGFLAGTGAALLIWLDDIRNTTFQIGQMTFSIGIIMDTVWTAVSGPIFGVVEGLGQLALALGALVEGDFEGVVDRWNKSAQALADGLNAPADAFARARMELALLEIKMARFKGIPSSIDPAAAKFQSQLPGPAAGGGTGASGGGLLSGASISGKALKALVATLKRLEKVRNELGATARQDLDTVFQTVATNQERYTAELDFLAQTRQSLLQTRQLTVENQLILERGAEAAKNRFEEAEKNNPIMLEAQGILAAVATEEERLIAFQAKLNQLVAAGALNWEQYNEILRRTSEELRRVERIGEDVGFILGDAFERATLGGEDFIDVLKDIGRQLSSLGIQNFITDPLSKFLGGLSGNIFGPSAGGPGPLPSPGGFAESFAHGGRPPVGVPSLVGERGPELFVPDTAGRVIPNSHLGGGEMAPVTISVAITTQGNINNPATLRIAADQAFADAGAKLQRAMVRNR